MLSKIKNIFTPASKQKAATLYPEANQLFKALYQLFGTNMPITINDNLQEYIDQGYSYNADLYAIVNKYCKECSRIKPKLIREVRGEKEELTDHELLDLLYEPSPGETLQEFIHASIGYKKLNGNSYIYLLSPTDGMNAGKAKELHVMPAQFVRILSDGYLQPIQSYVIDFRFWQTDPISSEQIIHLKEWNPGEGYHNGQGFLYGMPPLRSARNLLRSSNDAYIAKMKLLQNSGAIGILGNDSETQLTPEQAAQLKAKFKEVYQGADNYGEIIIAASKVKWESIGMNAVDMQILESLKNDFQTMCDIFDVPVELFARSEGKTFNNKGEARKQLLINSVIPEMESFYEKLSYICKPYQKAGETLYFEPDVENIPELQADLKEQVEILEKAWWLSPDEKRESMGHDMLGTPEMGAIYKPTNLEVLGGGVQGE